jgi:hypothetical protein
MTKRMQGGKPSTNLAFSAHVGSNDLIFPKILDLHCKPGARIADVTYGKGVFWRKIPSGKYETHFSDLKTGTDCRRLPYSDQSLEAVVFDPPYIEGFYRNKADALAGAGSHGAFRDYYSDGTARDGVDGFKYHDAVLAMYAQAAVEAKRVLRPDGHYIVKCQDEVSANRQKSTHVELIYLYELLGFYCKDIIVVVRDNRPGVSRLKQQTHARKNHSYFLVLRNCAGKLPYSNFRTAVFEAMIDSAKKYRLKS